jgi:hypothetical protein
MVVFCAPPAEGMSIIDTPFDRTGADSHRVLLVEGSSRLLIAGATHGGLLCATG